MKKIKGQPGLCKYCQIEELRAENEALRKERDQLKREIDGWRCALNKLAENSKEERDTLRAKLAQVEASRERVKQILRDLYEHDKNYIEINHLGHPHHNLVMWNAYDELERRKDDER